MDKTLKLKWKSKKYTFSQEELEEIFSKYGKIEYLILSKKKGNAVIQFKSLYSAYSVIVDKQEKCNKLISKIDISWASKEEPEIIKKFENSFKNEYNKFRKTVQSNNIKDNSNISESNNSTNDTSTKNSNNNKSKIEDILNEQKSNIPEFSFSSSPSGFSFNATEKMNMSLDDYENYTLMKMRKMKQEKMKEDLLNEK
jgi:DnaJ family protein C protein 17